MSTAGDTKGERSSAREDPSARRALSVWKRTELLRPSEAADLADLVDDQHREEGSEARNGAHPLDPDLPLGELLDQPIALREGEAN